MNDPLIPALSFLPLLFVARYVPRARQTLFFSATWPREVRSVASGFAINAPVQIFIGNVSVSLVATCMLHARLKPHAAAQDRPVAAATIKQRVRIVSGGRTDAEKLAALREYLLSKPPGSRILVFVGMKAKADWLQASLASG